MKKVTVVISAFPACGKSFAYNNYQDKYNILDSDSSKFDKRCFPYNYIEHIKDNLGKADIIFVSSHQNVRDALTDNDIDYVTVYPELDCKDEWLFRMQKRGSPENFIQSQDENWNDRVKNVIPHGHKLYRLHHNQFITLDLLDKIVDFMRDIL